MAAKRYTIRLYEKGAGQRGKDVEANLDPRDDATLRKTLERLVKAQAGTLQLDLSRWRIEVRTLGGGMIHARCAVNPFGDTVVSR